MALEHPNITLGTAGHIDHGKTELIKFLTGCDTDRLKAEKERGMSIDLGYAPCTLANMQVGIVDVPGHEHFVKTMVAGAAGMDGAILVVAADDGVMPQTREHLDILTLLGVRHGVVALTKIDKVDADHQELATEELIDFLRGTFLEDAPVLPVCNLTGEGFEDFYRALADLVGAIRPKRTDGVFRVPVDRAFSARGHGTVVAGIPVSGSAREGDEIVLLPQGIEGRIRSIEVYGDKSDVVRAGQCAALNVRHWEQGTIKRGNVIAEPGYFEPSEWYVCAIRLLPHERLALKNGARARFHTGTSEQTAAVYLVEGSRLHGGEESIIQVRLSDPLVAGPGDPFILRSLSPVATIGGGTVVEAMARRQKRNRPGIARDLARRAAAAGSDRDFVEYCVRTADGLVADEASLSRRAKLPRALLSEVLGELARDGRITGVAGERYAHADTLSEAAEAVTAALTDFHTASPAAPGMERAALADATALPRAVLDAAVARLLAVGGVTEDGGRLALPEHTVSFSPEEQRLLDGLEAAFRDAGFRPPSPDAAVEQTGADRRKGQWALKTLLAHDRLVEVADGLVFHREAVDGAREALVDYIRREGRLESVKFKYLLDTSRKYAIPLLDYFDRVGVTSRVGHTRHLKGEGRGGQP